MKKIFLILSLILFTLNQAKTINDSLYIPNDLSEILFNECDACGCAAGNGSSGFESLLNPQFIGVKYFAQHYKAKENLFVNDLTQDQYFNTIQLWAKIPIRQKLSVYASLPFHFHEKKTSQGDININGIGDFNLMGIYKLINSKDNKHELNVGVGVKVPLGKFDEKGISGVNPSFQLGTGSWDYQAVLNYRFQINKLAVLLNTDYTIKTENKKHYQFGNQWNYSATGFYQIVGTEKMILSAKAGLQGEVYDRNRQYKEDLPKTAGSALYGKLGFEASYKKVSLGTELMLPTYTNLAGRDIEAKSRLSVFINFGI
ncbi:transporter [Chryseobacterium indoltheticum]|uniref:Protein involved in meta-pathway of phenol degradation n=1 Tax=Chryseobacterium indoltheticum TaxID=254 RepID=A0A381FK04_9FLAO|nr:transporter [Chryseobacterium indoltheticum]SUX46889.1 Protein involved in meta-pathway of phenol degradation [Chryseobacterium indoltheticum]